MLESIKLGQIMYIFDKTFKAMILKVCEKTVAFNQLPPLQLLRKEDNYIYKVSDASGNTVLRKVDNTNAVDDLNNVLELLEPSALYTFTTDLTDAEKRIASRLVTLNKRHASSGYCYYEASTGYLKALYPDMTTCARFLDIPATAAKACNLGYTSIIKGKFITTSHYMNETEFMKRRKAHARRGCIFTHVYVYDYNGDFVGSFRSIADTARILGINFQHVCGGIIVPNSLHDGYYFFDNPDSRPDINIDKTI